MRAGHDDALSWIDGALGELERAGLRRRLAVRRGMQTGRVVLDGRELINFGSNDYLGLASDERLIEAAREAAQREGWGSGASPLVSGRSETHAELERRLAEFEGAEAALVFPSGFAVNAGVMPALVDERDAIFGDAKNHASLIDGCRLSRAKRFVFPHRDVAALERMLRESGDFRRRLIVTDTLFSMDGDLASLLEIADLAERYDAMLMVDEAHATGVFGSHGRGVVECMESVRLFRSEKKGTEPFVTRQGALPSRPHPSPLPEGGVTGERVHIRIGTLSKALGSGGGFVCGRRSLIEWLANRARTYVFSTAQPAATSAAAIAALDIVEQEPQRREGLLAAATSLRRQLREQGWNVGNSQSQIIPLIVGDADRTMRLAASLREAGFFVPGIRPPSVPEGESLLRLSLCYHHTAEMVGDLLKALGDQGPMMASQ
ncbi:MAG TPA: 8-amino-7-oxononanoate synthase [Lacipirellulaceae bacterium]|nr:8-amino-7-oxononanoate synthase [Lacipirellulaceae bacterium]